MRMWVERVLVWINRFISKPSRKSGLFPSFHSQSSQHSSILTASTETGSFFHWIGQILGFQGFQNVISWKQSFFLTVAQFGCTNTDNANFGGCSTVVTSSSRGKKRCWWISDGSLMGMKRCTLGFPQWCEFHSTHYRGSQQRLLRLKAKTHHWWNCHHHCSNETLDQSLHFPNWMLVLKRVLSWNKREINTMMIMTMRVLNNI